MQFLTRFLGRWPVALACVVVLAAAVLLPGLGRTGLWEPQERQLVDRVAPRPEVAAKQTPQPEPAPPKDGCLRMAPREPVARSLTNRAMVWGRDTLGASDAGRRLPLALLGLLTVLATAGIAMRLATARAGVVTALVLLSMPLLVFQSRQLLSEIGVAAGGALTLYGLVALGRPSGRLGLTLIDSLVALVALAAGVAIGFVAGGALLGMLVPIAAYAAAHGLGVVALRGAGRGMTHTVTALAGTLRPRTLIGRDFGRAAEQVAWLELVLGVLFAVSGLVLGVLERDTGVPLGAYALVAAGVPLLVHGGFVVNRLVAGASFDSVKAFAATLVAAVLLGVLVYQIFALREPQPGLVPPQRAVLGKAIVATGCWSPALGALWRPEDDLRFSFDSSFEQIAYGTFPWGILGPIAMVALLASGDRRRRIVGALTLAWAGAAWVASEVFQRKVGFTLWAGFPALALAIGVWLDAVLARRSRATDADGDAASDAQGDSAVAGTMLIGLFVVLAVIDLGKDLQSFTERLSSLLVGGDAVAYPKMSRLLLLPTKLWLLVLGAITSLGFAVAMITWRDDARAVLRRKAARIGALVALAGTAVFAAFWSYAWLPTLSVHLSSKAMFDTFQSLKRPGDQLVIMGDMGDAPHAYAPGTTPELVSSREQLVAAIGRTTNRVFAIAPQTELCQLHREIGGKPYYVIDDRNVRSLMLSNKVDGTTDKNPLRTAILHAEPPNIPFRPAGRVVFDNRIELLGWDMPKKVGRGDKFTVKMFYKVLQPVGGNWRVLFHFDGGLRFNGDHEPIKGRCQTSTWQPGDFIVDSHTVTAGAGAFTPGPYEVWTGFFTGSAPNWKNMPVSEAPAAMRDTADRVKITAITLD